MAQQVQQQMFAQKQDSAQAVLNAELLLDMTQGCIRQIKTLGNMLIQEQNKNGKNGKKGKLSSKGNDKQLFIQQMLVGQMINSLRIAVSDDDMGKNSADLSLVALGHFKKELGAIGCSKEICDKLMAFVETVQQTLIDYKKTFHVPGPKLDASTFNQDAVSNGMSKFLQAQHDTEEFKQNVLKNASKFSQKHKKLLNKKSNQEMLESMKNEEIDSSKIGNNAQDKLFDNIDKSYLEASDDDANNDVNMDRDFADRIIKGNAAMKEESYHQVQRNYGKWQQEQSLIL